MKILNVFSIIFIGLTLGACLKSGNKGSAVVAKPVQVEKYEQKLPEVTEKFEMPIIKYPAAILIEGGQGSPWIKKDRNPFWRLYICLKKTDRPVSGKLILDLDNLGDNVEIVSRFVESQDVASVKRFKRVIFEYTYDAKISIAYNENLLNYAFGTASFVSTTQQDIEWDESYGSSRSHFNDRWSIFENKLGHNDLRHEVNSSYTRLDNKEYYVFNKLERFSYGEKDRELHAIEVCEKNDKPFVLQVGSEITVD
jgi:hypothetical protein